MKWGKVLYLNISLYRGTPYCRHNMNMKKCIASEKKYKFKVFPHTPPFAATTGARCEGKKAASPTWTPNNACLGYVTSQNSVMHNQEHQTFCSFIEH
jgi:hypothetical protein